jgi:hypothetical protein
MQCAVCSDAEGDGDDDDDDDDDDEHNDDDDENEDEADDMGNWILSRALLQGKDAEKAVRYPDGEGVGDSQITNWLAAVFVEPMGFITQSSACQWSSVVEVGWWRLKSRKWDSESDSERERGKE